MSDHTIMIILVMKLFLVQFFYVFLPPLEGQGSLVCYSPQGHKASDTTERLNDNKKGISSPRRAEIKCSSEEREYPEK